MARYYTKQTLTQKVSQLAEATGHTMTLVSCNGEHAIQYTGGTGFGWAGHYHTTKELIIYLDGFLSGIKHVK